MMQLFMGVDIGTTNAKCAVYDEKGTEVAYFHRTYPVSHAQRGVREIDPHYIWDCAADVIKSAAAACQGKGHLATLAVSSFGESFVPIDKDGNILWNAIVYTDPRGEKELATYLEGQDRDALVNILGAPLNASSYSIPKLLYMREHHPDLYEKAEFFLLIADFIYWKLGGYRNTHHSLASRTMLFNTYTCQYEPKLGELFEVDIDKFSTSVDGGSVIGNPSPAMADELGLPHDLKLVMGGHDQACVCFGTGAGRFGTGLGMGTTECTSFHLEAPMPFEQVMNGLTNEPGLIPGYVFTRSGNATAGLSMDWFFKTFAADRFVNGAPPYDEFEAATDDTPSDLLVLPYLQGCPFPHFDSMAKLAFVGMTPSTTVYEMYKALLEALVFDQLQSFNERFTPAGIRPEKLICGGGGSRNTVWLKRKADILQVPVSRLQTPEVGCLGIAAMSAASVGAFTDVYEALEAMVHITETFEPNMQAFAQYEPRYELFRTLYYDLKKYNDALGM